MDDSDDQADRNIWQQALAYIRAELDDDEFRRWFGETSYASDSGDQITVWVPSETVRRYLDQHYGEKIGAALAAAGRESTGVRFVATGVGEDEDDD